MNSKRGKLITFEGIDRCGKTTQARLLKRNLDQLGTKCLLTSEPGSSGQLGKALRELLLDPGIERDEVTASLLFAADRHEHIKKVIKPALESGRWVLCDRFADSTLAYQGGGGNVAKSILNTLAEIAVGDCKPDLTFLLTLDTNKRSKRSPKLDYYDQGRKSFEQRVANAFDQLAEKEPERFVVIAGDQPIQRISKQILQAVIERFSPVKNSEKA